MAVDINGDGLIALGGTSTTQGRVRLAEDTDNGTNYVELTANAAVTTNRTVTFPDADINFTTGLGAAQGGTGATTLTAENVVIGNGTSSVKFVAPGTTGNVLTSNGTAWTSAAAAAGGGDYIMQVFTTPGTWTKAAGLKAIRVTVIGGGGGFAFPTSPASTGGTSSFGAPAFLSATGGGGGGQGAGGAGSGGQLNASGMRGFSPNQPFGGCLGLFTGAIGGASAFGFAQGNPFGGTAVAGLAYGGGAATSSTGCGGGGGAIEYIDAPALPGPQPYTVGSGGSGSPGGAAGAAGVIVVEEFY
jgi:hypothetical protein